MNNIGITRSAERSFFVKNAEIASMGVDVEFLTKPENPENSFFVKSVQKSTELSDELST